MTQLNLQSGQDLALGREAKPKRNWSIRVPSQQKLNLCPSRLLRFHCLEGMKRKKHRDGSGSLLLGPVPSPVLTECKLLEDQYRLGTRWSPGLACGAPCSAFQQPEAGCSPEPWLLPELIKEGYWVQACSWIIQEDRWAPVQPNRGINKWPWAEALCHPGRGHFRLCVPYTWILKRFKRNVQCLPHQPPSLLMLTIFLPARYTAENRGFTFADCSNNKQNLSREQNNQAVLYLQSISD